MNFFPKHRVYNSVLYRGSKIRREVTAAAAALVINLFYKPSVKYYASVYARHQVSNVAYAPTLRCLLLLFQLLLVLMSTISLVCAENEGRPEITGIL